MGFTLYGALAALALAAMLAVTFLAGRKNGVDYGCVIRFAVLAVPLALIFSRLTYCLTSLSYYTETIGHPELLLQLRDGGYSMTGAMLGVIIASMLAGKWCRRPCGAMLDAAAIGMSAALIIARLAEPLADMGWGYPYYSPLFCFLDGLTENMGDFAFTHPVFAYEATVAAAILVSLLIIRRQVGQGYTFLAFLLLYGCSQTVMESLLNGGHMKVIHFVKVNQIAALVMLLIPLVVWSIRLARIPHFRRCVFADWALAIVCILSAVVQEFSVEGADNPYFSVVLVGAVMAGLLGLTTLLRSLAWKRYGFRRLLPVIIPAVIAIAAAVVDRVTDVGDHYRLVLWGIMACDMAILAAIGLRQRAICNINP
ncbi:MAG: prolipoprotein diacylglyceryl transferase [Clostridia bacterium]|nr:prolipoprotein diacylglyceryl transferase [Clostridia bacterium]